MVSEGLSAERVDLTVAEVELVDRLAAACGRDRMGLLRWLVVAALADPGCWPAGTDEQALG